MQSVLTYIYMQNGAEMSISPVCFLYSFFDFICKRVKASAVDDF